MADKLCTKCGRLNAAHANFCSACGAQDFAEASAEQMTGISPSQGAVADASVLLSGSRMVVLSAVTSGLYFYYWLYITWKQLQGETRDIHYPVWHALTLLVPVYGLFRLYKHGRVIQDLALRAGVEVSFTPGLAVVLVGLNWLLAFGSASVQSLAGLLVLILIRLALTTTAMVWAQGTLNAYWYKVRGTPLQDVPIGAGERAIIFLGLFIWLLVLLSVLQG